MKPEAQDQPPHPVTVAATDIRYNPPMLMNTEECAAFLGIGTRTLRRYAATRRIPSVKIGGTVRFRLESMIRFLEKEEVAAF